MNDTIISEYALNTFMRVHDAFSKGLAPPRAVSIPVAFVNGETVITFASSEWLANGNVGRLELVKARLASAQTFVDSENKK